jgi:hypothetical protein
MTKPRIRPPKAAPATAAPTSDPVDGELTLRARGVVERGIGLMDAAMAALAGDSSNLEQVVLLTEKAATIMSHLRRADESLRNAGKKLSPAAVLAFLRAMPPEQRADLLAEFGAAEDAAGKSVLG